MLDKAVITRHGQNLFTEKRAAKSELRQQQHQYSTTEKQYSAKS